MKTVSIAAAFAAATLVFSGAANATVVNFDDLSGDGFLADGYGGITWDGAWAFYDSTQDPYNPSSGFTRIYAIPCCDNGETSFSFAAPVVFDGAFFAGHGASSGYGPISFNLYSGATLVHTSSGLDASGTPTFLASGYSGSVDRVGVVGTRSFYVMDDVTYNGGAVPEPATWAMMIIGFGAAGSMIRRRKAVVA